MKHLNIGTSIKDGIDSVWIDNGDGKGKIILEQGGNRNVAIDHGKIKGVRAIHAKELK